MQKKNVVAVLVIACALMLAGVPVFAQAAAAPSAQPNSASDQDIEMLRADLRAQRKQITAQNMTLTADEATKFWPIFDQYRKEAIKPNLVQTLEHTPLIDILQIKPQTSS